MLALILGACLATPPPCEKPGPGCYTVSVKHIDNPALSGEPPAWTTRERVVVVTSDLAAAQCVADDIIAHGYRSQPYQWRTKYIPAHHVVLVTLDDGP